MGKALCSDHRAHKSLRVRPGARVSAADIHKRVSVMAYQAFVVGEDEQAHDAEADLAVGDIRVSR